MRCPGARRAALISAALLVATLAPAHAEPRTVIDWLDKAPEPADGSGAQWPPPATLEQQDEPSASTAAPAGNGPQNEPPTVLAPLAPPEIVIVPVAGVVADSAGLLTEVEGGFAPDLWKGVPAERARTLLRSVGPSSLRSVNQLARAALLTAASAPAEAEEDGEIATLRAQALLELGLPSDALKLLQASSLRTPVAMALQLDAAALTGEDSEVCALALRSGSLDDLAARRIYCLARTGARQEATLALSTGRDLGQIREEDGRLLEALIEPTWAEFARPPDRVQDLTPLRLAALDRIGAPRPSDFNRLAPLSMRWADMNEDAPPRDRLTAAEQLEEAGALSTDALRDLYAAYTPAESGGVWGRVEAWRAAREANGGYERAAAVALAYDRAAQNGRESSMARLLAPFVEGARPTTEDGSPEVRRVLALAGNYGDAAHWFATPPSIGQRAAALIADPRTAPRLGKAQIAALRARDSLGDLAAGQQLAALTAFGLMDRESRFTTTRELSHVIQALESEQPAEALFAALNFLGPGADTRPEPFNAALAALLALGREDDARRIALEALARRL